MLETWATECASESTTIVQIILLSNTKWFGCDARDASEGHMGIEGQFGSATLHSGDTADKN